MSQERVSGFPEKGADLRGSLGNFRGSLGNFRGTSGLLLSSTVRELPGKSPKNFRGSSGNFWGSLGNFPEARGSLTPSQRLAKFVSKFWYTGNFGALLDVFKFMFLVFFCANEENTLTKLSENSRIAPGEAAEYQPKGGSRKMPPSFCSNGVVCSNTLLLNTSVLFQVSLIQGKFHNRKFSNTFERASSGG